ncbi:MAG: hypothetical protein ABSF84_02960 [Acidimicrobiales bacterium]
MTRSVVEILQLVEILAHRLTEPVDDAMRAGGWREERRQNERGFGTACLRDQIDR